MKRAHVEIQKDSYAAKVAARMRELLGDRPASHLAEAAKVTVDAALKWLRGDSSPSLDKFPAIAKALGVHPSDLMP